MIIDVFRYGVKNAPVCPVVGMNRHERTDGPPAARMQEISQITAELETRLWHRIETQRYFFETEQRLAGMPPGGRVSRRSADLEDRGWRRYL